MLASVLKKLREVQKLTQKNCKNVGVLNEYGCKWKTGDRHPDHEMLLKIADLLDVSFDSCWDAMVFEARWI